MQGTEKIVITTSIPQIGNLSVANLMEGMKPVVVDKGDFECRDESKVVTHFGIFGLSRF